MSNTYTITIQNNTGTFRNYSIINGQPQVSGQGQPQAWSNVFATAPCPPGGVATFTIQKLWSAVSGTSNGSPKPGATVNISSTKNVTLGKTQSNGSQEPGSTVNYITSDQGGLVPYFAPDYLPASGFSGAFALNTTGPFTNQDAKFGNWLVGLGGSINGATTPAAMFVPSPNMSYQIKPSSSFYISTQQLAQGSLVDPNMLGNALQLDFSSPNQRPSVVVNNTPDGQLVPMTS